MSEPMAATMHDLLTLMIERGASDLHITTGTHPQIRLHGKLTALTQFDVLMPAGHAAPGLQRAERRAEAEVRGGQRARPVLRHPGARPLPLQRLPAARRVAAAIRVIPVKIRGFDELGLPAIVEQIADRPKGLILVTGPTGSGKSTTLAAMVDKINSRARPSTSSPSRTRSSSCTSTRSAS